MCFQRTLSNLLFVIVDKKSSTLVLVIPNESRMADTVHSDQFYDYSIAMEALQSLPGQRLREELLRCCHSTAWADGVRALMPFKSEEDARTTLDQCWSNLNMSDYLEAITAHPAIGDKEALRDKFAPSRSGWEGAEQAASAGASEAVLDELSELNKAYMDKNGFVFLICATGKPADTILAALKERLPNDRDTEIRNAVEEQRKITQLRFTRLLEDVAVSTAREAEGSSAERANERQWSRPRSRL